MKTKIKPLLTGVLFLLLGVTLGLLLYFLLGERWLRRKPVAVPSPPLPSPLLSCNQDSDCVRVNEQKTIPKCLNNECRLVKEETAEIEKQKSAEGQFCGGRDKVPCPNLYYCLPNEQSIANEGQCLKGDIDSQEDPELGLAGFSSGDLVINKTKIHLRLLAADRQKIVLPSFPCVDEKTTVTVVKGNFRIMAFDSTMKKLIDRLEIGKKEFVMEPADIEQTGRFSKLIVLNQKPRYEAFTLAFRKSCSDTEVFLYSFDDKQQKVVIVPFIRKGGKTSDSIFIPKGLGIPQLDAQGNVISSSYNLATGWRDKVRYKFNLDKFAYEEIEAYSQPEETPVPPKTEEQLCGGFVGFKCPEGYTCKLDGNYPDASGKCVKN